MDNNDFSFFVVTDMVFKNDLTLWLGEILSVLTSVQLRLYIAHVATVWLYFVPSLTLYLTRIIRVSFQHLI